MLRPLGEWMFSWRAPNGSQQAYEFWVNRFRMRAVFERKALISKSSR